MQNIFGYLKKYGDVSFQEKEFNVIDSMVFSCLVYIDFTDLIKSRKENLCFALRNLLNVYRCRELIRSKFFSKNIMKLVKELISLKRFKDVVIYNYEYKLTDDEQFGALTYKLEDGTVFVGFLGTDDYLVGWKEDFDMFHKFPVPAHKDAIKYLNKTVGVFDKKVIVGGHSKGGNLALVSSMFANFFVRLKIKKVINLDGPGLRYKEITSKKYQKTQEKYVLIVPNYSVFGLLLRHSDDYLVVKSNSITFDSHSPFSWVVDDDKLRFVQLSDFSRKLDESLNMWLNEHDDATRKYMVDCVFDAIKKSGVVKTIDIFNVKKFINLIKEVKGLDVGTKNLIMDLLKFNFGYVIDKKRN